MVKNIFLSKLFLFKSISFLKSWLRKSYIIVMWYYIKLYSSTRTFWYMYFFRSTNKMKYTYKNSTCSQTIAEKNKLRIDWKNKKYCRRSNFDLIWNDWFSSARYFLFFKCYINVIYLLIKKLRWSRCSWYNVR